jgi:isopentenyl-diphosphate delta-isomerase
MINREELLYVVDEFDEKLTPLPRHKVFKKGLWRRTTHVWIFNDKKQVFCQRRSLKKDISPGMWEATVAGHLGPDDNYFTGAVREVFEETGIVIDPSDLNLLKIYKDHERKEYRAIFYCKLNIEPHKVKIEEDEVEEVKLVHLKTLKNYLMHKQSDSWISQGYMEEMFSILSNH